MVTTSNTSHENSRSKTLLLPGIFVSVDGWVNFLWSRGENSAQT